MALYQASDFTGFSESYAIPSGSPDVVSTGSVDLILPTGITQQVFGTLSTALKCIHLMEQQKAYSLSPDEDVTIINLRSKLWVLENTYSNQKTMNSDVFTYHGKEVRAIHRSMADMVSLCDALSSVGFRCIGLPWNSACSVKAETDRADKDRPRIQVIYYVYKSLILPRTNLEDGSPIVTSYIKTQKHKLTLI